MTYCDPIPVEGDHRIVHKKDVLAFLCKLRQGCSDEFLKIIFDFPTIQAVSMAINTALESLKLRFVQENIGLTRITRE